MSRSPSSLALRPRYSVSGFRRAASDVWLPFLGFSKTPARATRLTLVLSKNTFILKEKSLRALLDPLNDQTFFPQEGILRTSEAGGKSDRKSHEEIQESTYAVAPSLTSPLHLIATSQKAVSRLCSPISAGAGSEEAL